MPSISDHDMTIIVVLCARISTANREHNPDIRLLHLREFCNAQGWSICRKYIGKASSADFAIRITSKKIGRPRVIHRQGFNTRFKTILERLREGDTSRRAAARELGIGYATLKRLLDTGYEPH